MQINERHAITATVKINAHSCWSCGVIYGLTDDFEASRRANGGTFYCPNGHAAVFADTELERARKELLKAKARADQLAAQRDDERRWRKETEIRLEVTEKSRSSLRGQVTKLKNRAKNGVCPCCRRHFANVQRHMATEHPDFTASADEA
jgi:hypothetical protein